MKMKLLCSVLLSVCTAGVSLGATLFVHNFDNLGGATLDERLTADYAEGNSAPVNIVQEVLASGAGFPDVYGAITGGGTPKFGDGTMRARSGNVATQLTFSAPGNVNVTRGSVEVWVSTVWTSSYERYFQIGNPTGGETIQIYMHAGNKAYAFQIKSGGAGGQSHTIATPNNVAFDWNHANHPGWQLLGIEWDLSTGAASTNYMRLYLNGERVDEKIGGINSFMVLQDETVFGLGSQPWAANTNSSRAWMDSMRITSSVMSELYELDAEGNYAPPTAAFVPEPATLSLLLLGGMIWRRRQIG